MSGTRNGPVRSLRFEPERAVRAHIEPVTGYSRGAAQERSRDAIQLDWNESPFGLSPRAQIAYDAFRTGNRYPDLEQTHLTGALAAYVGTTPERVIVGAGLDDVFTTTALTIIEPGDEVIISDPTFGVYRSLFELHGASVVNVPLGPAPDFALPVEEIVAVISARTKLVIVCNPNNPTGTLFGKAEIESIVARAPCLVAIDEAYAEFSGVAHRDLADRYPNVILFRTMSKFAGLAGYRVGYGIFPPSILPWVRRAAPAFRNVSAISAAVAIASLEDRDYLMANVRKLVTERERVAAALRQIEGVLVYPSAANFLLIAPPMPDTAEIVDELARRQVFIRRFADPALGLRHCVRVSIGSATENDMFLERFTEALSGTMR